MKPGQRWFALVEDFSKDTLRVFHRDVVASSESAHSVCSANHVCELVVHWMVTGSLDYPFAGSGRRREPERCSPPLPQRVGTRAPSAIGELAIDREAMTRVIYENPGAVQVMLEGLHEALEKSLAMPAQAVSEVRFPEFLVPPI
ncbi:MAG TPA: hypothetical protein VF753_07530 [Terriglobales bacterium]